MKTSFLKSFFNSKDMCPKNNFDIHSVDLDESDDVLVDPDNFIVSNSLMKNRETFKRKSSIFSPNDSMSSNCSMEIKSPSISKGLDFAKFRKSPCNSPALSNKNTPRIGTPGLTNLKIFNNKNISKKSPVQQRKNILEIFSPRNNTNFMKENKQSNLNDDRDKLEAKHKEINLNKNLLTNKFNDVNKRTELEETKDFYGSIMKLKSSEENNHCTENMNIISQNDTNKRKIIEFNNCNEFEKQDNSSVNSQREVNDEIEESDNTKLKALHMKLKFEAEKIYKWKESMEKDINSKTKKLQECEKIIESLRTSNLDLQMRQESISLSYQEEIESRTDFMKKIDNSRQMCQAIKDRIELLESLYQHNKTEKEKLSYFQTKLGEIMSSLFADVTDVASLHKSSVENIKMKNEIIIQLTQEVANVNENIEKQKLDHNNELKGIEDLLIVEKYKISEINDKCTQLTVDKDQVTEFLENEKRTNAELEQHKNAKAIKIVELESNVEKLNFIVAELQDKLKIKTEDFDSLNEKFSHLEIQFSEDMNEKKKELDNLNCTVKVKDELLNANEVKLSETVSLIAELENLNLHIKEKNLEKLSLKDLSIDKLTNSLIENETLLSDSLKKIEKHKSELDLLKSENDNILSNNTSLLKSNNNDLREEINLKSTEICDMNSLLQSHKESLDKSDARVIDLSHKLSEHEDSLSELKDKLMFTEGDLVQTKEELKKTECTKHKLEITLDKLQISEKHCLLEKENFIIGLEGELESFKQHNHLLISENDFKCKQIKIQTDKINNFTSVIETLEARAQDLETKLEEKLCKTVELSGEVKTKNQEINLHVTTIKQYEETLVENKQNIKEYMFKISSLETFVNELSIDKQTILKSREDLRKELMFTLEHCKNEHEITERKKSKEIENLRKNLELLNNESQTNSKKTKSKLQDAVQEITKKNEEVAKLNDLLNTIDCNRNALMEEMKTLKLILETTNLKSNDTEKRCEQLETKKLDLENEILQHLMLISDLKSSLEAKDEDIIKLKSIEFELNESRNFSPPCTQVPEYIKLSGAATPKSQTLTNRLDSIEDISNIIQRNNQKTPQKTPKGILRQPGSASKRRKVIFEEKKSMKLDTLSEDSSISDCVDIDLESMNNSKKKRQMPKTTNLAVTPKKQNVSAKFGLTDSRNTGRLSNIRKTPSKTTIKLTEEKKDKDNWFDSDNFFGVSIEA